MASHCSAFIATSLDGFIARPDGGLDWLDQANAKVPAGEDCGYAEYVSSVDAIVMGRRSFEKVLTFAAWPYGETPVYVLSRTLDSVPDGAPSSVALHAGPPEALLEFARARGHERLYVDGGATVSAFVNAGLLREITITVIPVLLGAGRPLFAALAEEIPLRHLSTRCYPFGFVQIRYAIMNAA
jgi:dihydrofolate reductase